MQRGEFIGEPVARLTYVCERPVTVTTSTLSFIGGTRMTTGLQRETTLCTPAWKRAKTRNAAFPD